MCVTSNNFREKLVAALEQQNLSWNELISVITDRSPNLASKEARHVEKMHNRKGLRGTFPNQEVQDYKIV
jgi:predicted Zn-ribbon and HTH transcriptional regulator